MPIEIKVEHLMRDGMAWVKVLSVKALRESKLPSEYFLDRPYCYLNLTGDALEVWIPCSVVPRILRVYGLYPLNYFKETVKFIRKSGQRLYEINQEQKQNKKGKIQTIVI